MGAKWYSVIAFYGYKIQVPECYSYRKFVSKLCGLNDLIEKPFEITGILEEFHNHMDSLEYGEMDDLASIIIGFTTHTYDLETINRLDLELKEYIKENPILEGFEIEDNPGFYSGIDWFDSIEIDEDELSDYDEDDNEEEDEEEDDEEEENDEGDFRDDSSTSSDEEAHKPESKKDK